MILEDVHASLAMSFFLFSILAFITFFRVFRQPSIDAMVGHFLYACILFFVAATVLSSFLLMLLFGKHP